MNNTPFWLPLVVTVVVTMMVGAFALPIAEAVYRAENWLLTWVLPELERAERRDAFERQLLAFLDEERRQGYQPQSSGLRLLSRMLSTLPFDVWDSSRAFAVKAYWLPMLLRLKLRSMRSLFDELRHPNEDHPYRHDSPDDIVWLDGHAIGQGSATATLTVTSPGDDGEALRIRQSNQASMDSAIQVIRQNTAWRESANRAAISAMGHRPMSWQTQPDNSAGELAPNSISN